MTRVGKKRRWAIKTASSKRKMALLWIPVGVVFAILADWPKGLLLIPLFCLLAAFLWWIAGVQERHMLCVFDKYGEDHPLTSWSAFGRWFRDRSSRAR